MRTTFVILLLAAVLSLTAIGVSPDGEEDIIHQNLPSGTHASDLEIIRNMRLSQTDLDPGTDPEGDYPAQVTFTPDGNRFLVTNMITDNVTVYDWQTMSVLANVSVGDFPFGIACNDQYAVVACVFSNEAYIVDLSDYTVLSQIPTGEQPAVVNLSPDGNTAYVSCEVDDVCEVIDLTTFSHVSTIQNFPIILYSFWFTSAHGRSGLHFSDFIVTPDNTHLIVSDFENSVKWIDIATGQEDFALDLMDVRRLRLSGDGTKLIAATFSDPVTFHQIDLSDNTVPATVSIPGLTPGTGDPMVVNQDGSKAYMGVSGNQSAFIRFDTGDYNLISDTYTAFWAGTSLDRSLVISGQYRFTILDFDTEAILFQEMGINQYFGAVSPSNNRVAACNPPGWEGLHLYDFTNPASTIYRGGVLCGEAPEADAPKRCRITPDGAKTVVACMLSYNLAIIDNETQSVLGYVDLGDQPTHVEITHDGAYALVSLYNSYLVKMVDIDAMSVICDIPVGDRPAIIDITPDDNLAYVENIRDNTVTVIALDGAGSTPLATLSTGVIGVAYAHYGTYSEIELTPDGAYLFCCASFDDIVKVIDTSDNTVATQLNMGDFPVRIAFNDTGDRAVVSNFYQHTATILDVDGDNTQILFNIPVSDYPLRCGYDPVNDRFAVCSYSSQMVTFLDPETGAVLETMNTSDAGSPADIRFNDQGEPIILFSDGILDGPDWIDLPASSAYFDYNAQAQLCAVVMPGPDYVTLLDWSDESTPLVADFSATPLSGDQPLEVQFTDASQGDVASWAWDFDHDGMIDSNQQNPLYTYLEPGTYSVALTVYDAGGLDTLVRDAYITVDPVSAEEVVEVTMKPVCYPNPFNPETTIRFALPRAGQVKLEILNVRGQRVATLVEHRMEAGVHKVVWDAKDMPSGVYLARLTAGGTTTSYKAVLMK